MQDPSQPNINGWLEEELLSQYRHDKKTVDADWSSVFDLNPQGNGSAVVHEASQISAPEAPLVAIAENDQVTPLRGPALRIAENMAASLSIPVATSVRAMPVKVIDENRRIINQQRSLSGVSKISYTHIVAWAIVRALEQAPALNTAYSERGHESVRITRAQVNLGLAVDVEGKDGAR